MTTSARSRSDLLLAVASVVIATILLVGLGGSTHELRLLGFFGRFHPLAVHLPIGMLLLVGALEAIAFVPKLRARVDPALAIVLRLALASSVVAFALGLMLASGGGYPERLLRLHRGLTFAMVVASSLSVVVWSLHDAGRAPRVVHRAAVALTLGLLGIGAHFGGSITHGEGWLSIEPAPAAAPAPAPSAAAAADPRVFDDVVLPILRKRCASCHGAESAKARLRVDSLEALTKGGKSGSAIKPGSARESLIMLRIDKPIADDAHMPPEGKPQLTPEEIELVALWIDRGASATTKVRELLVPDGARRLLEGARQRSGTQGAAEPTPAPTSTTVSAATATTTTPPPSEPTAPPRAVASTSEDAVFATRIEPILAAKCGRCHGATRQKGKLRTDSLAALMAGGASGPAIVPGAPERGTLLTRLRLPLADDRHMPPTDAPQLDASELAALSGWLGRAHVAQPQAAAPRPQPPSARSTPAPHPSATESPPEPATPATTPATTPAKVTRPVRLFADVVKPLLAKRCGACHSAEKPFAGVVATERDALVASKHLVPGRPDASPLFERIALALDDDDHMPPKKEPQPSAEEVAAVRLWIERGASIDGVVDASEMPSGLVPPPPESAPASADADAGASSPASTEVGRVRGGCGGCAAGTGGLAGPVASALGAVLLALVVLRRRARQPGDAASSASSR